MGEWRPNIGLGQGRELNDGESRKGTGVAAAAVGRMLSARDSTRGRWRPGTAAAGHHGAGDASRGQAPRVQHVCVVSAGCLETEEVRE